MNKEKYILFIDDEQQILDALTRSLRKWMHRIDLKAITAKSAHEAMNLINQYSNEIAVVVSDQLMPDLRGSELTRVISNRNPDTTIIILSGLSAIEDMTDLVGSGIFSFLQKPWDKESLQAEIYKGYELYKLKRENRLQRERQKKDLQMAGEFQKAFLKPVLPPEGDRISFKYSYLPFSEDFVSGDYFDFNERKDKRYVILLGDVANRGMKAALVTPFLKSLVYEHYIMIRDIQPFSPGLFLKWLNNRICFLLSKNPELYISFTAICVDMNRNVIITANAGSPPAYLVRNDKVVSIKPDGLVLGCVENQEYKEVITDFHSHDTLVAFTDGLYPSGLKNNDFSKSEIIDILKKCKDLEDHEELLQDILKSTGQNNWRDDLTLLTLKIL